MFCFRADWLWPALKRIRLSPKGEYYLTDVVEIAVSDGLEVRAVTTDDPTEAVGINNRVHLAEAEAILRQRTNTHWMLEGVTLIDPQSTYIEPGVVIGQDTIIWPNTYLRGQDRDRRRLPDRPQYDHRRQPGGQRLHPAGGGDRKVGPG